MKITRRTLLRSGALGLLEFSKSGATFGRTAPGIDVVREVSLERCAVLKLAPDGIRLFFGIQANDLVSNSVVTQFFLADGRTPPEPVLSRFVGRTLSHFCWSSDAAKLFFVAEPTGNSGQEVYCWQPSEGSIRQIAAIDEQNHGQIIGDPFRPDDNAIAPNPAGNLLALKIEKSREVHTRAKPSSNVQAVEMRSPDDRLPSTDKKVRSESEPSLYLFDIGRRDLRRISPAGLAVQSFCWSPTGDRLAVAACPASYGGANAFMGAQIFLIECATGSLRALWEAVGANTSPTWSPDGNHVAFLTQGGIEDWQYGARVGVCDLTKFDTRILGQDLARHANIRIDSSLAWLSNKTLRVTDVLDNLRFAAWDLGLDGSCRRAPGGRGWSWTRSSIATRARRQAIVCERAAAPSKIMIGNPPSESFDIKLELNRSLVARRGPAVETISWPSRDGRWAIHGLLISPTNRFESALPLIVVNQGGPRMVENVTRPRDNFPLLTLADRGYAILLPNSRGREGYGEQFRRAIPAEGSYVTLPAQDVLAGVDYLVQRGAADPNRMAMIGFSYGETLTMAALSADSRFKAAIVGGGHSDLMLALLCSNPRESEWQINRDLLGIPDQSASSSIKLMIEQTAIFHLSSIRTPVLIESGEHDRYIERQRLFRGLQSQGIPCEHVVYPGAGHGWQDKPLLLLESYRRHIAWLDYWLLDRPYPDPNAQSKYDVWKRVGTNG